MRISRLLAAAALALVASSPLVAQKAALSVVHGIPGLPAPVEVFANGSRLFAFSYGQVRGPLQLDPGTYRIEVKLAGRTVLSANPTVAADTNYSAVAHLSGTGALRLSFFVNDLAGLAASDSRVVARHLAQAPAVDIFAQPQGGSPIRLFQNVSNGMSGQADVPPTTYGVSINAAGTNTRVFGPVPLRTEARTVTVVYAVGSLARRSFRVIVQRIALPRQAQLTVIHGIPDLPNPVDVFVNGSKAFSFDFQDKVGPLCLDAGTYRVEVKLNGQTVLSGNPTLESGKSYNAVAHLQAQAGIKLSVFENNISAIRSGFTRVVARHLAKAPAVDVVARINGRDIRLFRNVTNGQEGSVQVAADSYELSLFAAGTNTRVFGPVRVSLRSNAVYQIHAVGDIGGKFGLVINTYDRASMRPLINVASVGRSCGGRIWTNRSNIRANERFSINLFGARGDATALLLIGVAAPTIDLGPIGAPTCSLYQRLSVIVPKHTSFFGSASQTLRLGADHVKDLTSVRAQWAYPTRTNSLGLRFTSALEFSKL